MSQRAIEIRPIADLDMVDLAAMRDEAAREGYRFVDRLADEYASGANRFDRPGEALFGAYDGEELVGVAGLNIDPYLDDAMTGRVRHLYVRPGSRQLGVGRRLVGAVVAAAGSFTRLTLYTNNPAADRLYRAAGFRAFTSDAHATHELSLERGGEP